MPWYNLRPFEKTRNEKVLPDGVVSFDQETGAYKVGTGVIPWEDLPSFGGSGGGGTVVVDTNDGPVMTIPSNFGIDEDGNVYYDTSGPAEGEEAVGVIDPFTGAIIVTKIDDTAHSHLIEGHDATKLPLSPMLRGKSNVDAALRAVSAAIPNLTEVNADVAAAQITADTAQLTADAAQNEVDVLETQIGGIGKNLQRKVPRILQIANASGSAPNVGVTFSNPLSENTLLLAFVATSYQNVYEPNLVYQGTADTPTGWTTPESEKFTTNITRKIFWTCSQHNDQYLASVVLGQLQGSYTNPYSDGTFGAYKWVSTVYEIADVELDYDSVVAAKSLATSAMSGYGYGTIEVGSKPAMSPVRFQPTLAEHESGCLFLAAATFTAKNGETWLNSDFLTQGNPGAKIDGGAKDSVNITMATASSRITPEMGADGEVFDFTIECHNIENDGNRGGSGIALILRGEVETKIRHNRAISVVQSTRSSFASGAGTVAINAVLGGAPTAGNRLIAFIGLDARNCQSKHAWTPPSAAWIELRASGKPHGLPADTPTLQVGWRWFTCGSRLVGAGESATVDLGTAYRAGGHGVEIVLYELAGCDLADFYTGSVFANDDTTYAPGHATTPEYFFSGDGLFALVAATFINEPQNVGSGTGAGTNYTYVGDLVSTFTFDQRIRPGLTAMVTGHFNIIDHRVPQFGISADYVDATHRGGTQMVIVLRGQAYDDDIRRSPNGTRYRIVVANNGTLSTEAV